MSADYTLGDTIYYAFTTRAFATGVPTALAGSPTLEIYENDSTSPIVEGASKLVLTQNLNSINGFNLATITATTGNGFEAGKTYHLIVKTGTVGGTSVVGEVVGRFTLQAEAAAVDLANGTDGLGAIKADTAAILVDTGTTLDGKIDTIDTVVDAIKAKTDSLTFTKAGEVDSNVQSVNDVTVNGIGTAGNPWGP